MYAKLFASLYQGTLRGNPDEILVFTNLLAHADSTGVVDKHWRAIAEEVGIPRERVEAAILNLESPDPESRSPEENGCRIVKMDEHRVWGWRIVNHGKYRAIRDEEDRREQNRMAQERWRNKNKQSKPRKPKSAQAEAEAEAEAEAVSSRRSRAQRIPDGWKPSKELTAWATSQGLNAAEIAQNFVDYWRAESGAKASKLDWDAAFRVWCRRQNGQSASRPQARSFDERKRDAATTVTPSDDISQWRARFRGWKTGAFWLEGSWGPEPGKPGCRVPAAILKEIQQ